MGFIEYSLQTELIYSLFKTTFSSIIFVGLRALAKILLSLFYLKAFLG